MYNLQLDLLKMADDSIDYAIGNIDDAGKFPAIEDSSLVDAARGHLLRAKHLLLEVIERYDPKVTD